jgi:hypothetical protein
MPLRPAAETIPELSIEHELEGLLWQHPWDHYPFIKDNGYRWLRCQDLDGNQRYDIHRALIRNKRRLREHSVSARPADDRD